MGVYFSHCNASWSCSSFNSFRSRLADLVKLNLNKMQGYGGARPWEEIQEDPIHLLLNHSDCDGGLYPEDCRKIAPRLRELLVKMNSQGEDYDFSNGMELVRGMERAAECNEYFCFI